MRTALWSVTPGTLEVLDYHGRPVTANSMDRTGRFVVGSIGQHAKGQVLLRDRHEGRWIVIDCPPQYLSTCVNARGDIAGAFRKEDGYRPWVKLLGEPLRSLPCLSFHDTMPSAMSDTGIIVGTCTADHGAHAIIWEPE
jgi:hypothetical protein